MADRTPRPIYAIYTPTGRHPTFKGAVAQLAAALAIAKIYRGAKEPVWIEHVDQPAHVDRPSSRH